MGALEGQWEFKPQMPNAPPEPSAGAAEKNKKRTRIEERRGSVCLRQAPKKNADFPNPIRWGMCPLHASNGLKGLAQRYPPTVLVSARARRRCGSTDSPLASSLARRLKLRTLSNDSAVAHAVRVARMAAARLKEEEVTVAAPSPSRSRCRRRREGRSKS